MPSLTAHHRVVRRYLTLAIAVAVATAAFVGGALAKAFTLQVARNAKVVNTAGMSTTEPILTDSRARAVYYLTGDSPRHPECTKANRCFTFWPPVTVASAKDLSKAAAIRGRLGVWHRNGFLLVTIRGRPLYRFAADRQKRMATGEGLKSFGGTWHVIKASATTPPGALPGQATPAPVTSGPPMSQCLYPPCS